MTDEPIQYGPPPLRPGYRWETGAERDERIARMDAPRPFSITIRAATADECVKLADGDANTTDGAAAVEVDGRVVAIHNEYGTLSYPPHCDRPDTYEELVARAMDVYELHMPTTELESPDA